MSFDLRASPRWRLNCSSWSRSGPRHAALAEARRSALRADGDDRQRRIRQYARDHRCPERDAAETLFGDGED